MQLACAKEREFGNVAFKACQYTEALAAYSRAIDHFKGDKTAHANRAAAHLKLRNWLSALDDCSRVIDVSKFLSKEQAAKWTALAQIARPDLPEIGRPRRPVDKLRAAAKAAMSARALAAFGA